MTLEISKNELNNIISKKPDIIIQDRGVIDNYFWYQMMFLENLLTEEEFYNKIINIKKDVNIANQLYVFTAEPETIVLRDYRNEIYIEDRKKTTLEKVSKLQMGIDDFCPVIRQNLNSDSELLYYDTTNISEMDTSIMVANSIIDGMEKQLVKVKK